MAEMLDEAIDAAVAVLWLDDPAPEAVRCAKAVVGLIADVRRLWRRAQELEAEIAAARGAGASFSGRPAWPAGFPEAAR